VLSYCSLRSLVDHGLDLCVSPVRIYRLLRLVNEKSKSLHLFMFFFSRFEEKGYLEDPRYNSDLNLQGRLTSSTVGPRRFGFYSRLNDHPGYFFPFFGVLVLAVAKITPKQRWTWGSLRLHLEGSLTLSHLWLSFPVYRDRFRLDLSIILSWYPRRRTGSPSSCLYRSSSFLSFAVSRDPVLFLARLHFLL